MNKQQLAAKIWTSVNQMRSKIEASEYKDYILGFIFYKFLSDKEEQFLAKNYFTRENIIEQVNEENTEVVDFVRNRLGYFISYENLYSTWLDKGADFNVADVRDALSAFARLVDPNKEVFDKVFDTLQTGLSKLGDTSGAQTKAIRSLIHLIRDIPTDGKQGYDVLGYIYEYLIGNFAANAGKKAGEFYTPHEVSVLIANIVALNLKGKENVSVYDPTSGSGSLLITIGEAVARHLGRSHGIKYYAQELKESTYNLTRMNLVMRGIRTDDIVCRCGDTLEDDWPFFKKGHPETYTPLFVDATVSNPPYSQDWDPEGKENDRRFSGYGIAPKSKADYAFLLHDLYHLNPEGVMCIVLPHGVLFRGGEEERIRAALVEHDNIDVIIGLPANIFYGTGIPTIVMVLKKRRPTNNVLIIDASKGFIKDGKQNRLRARDIRRIVDAYQSRSAIPRFCRPVEKDEIRANDYNLNIPRYVDSSEPEDHHDLYAMMFGGIPVAEIDALEDYWKALPGLKELLFEPASKATMKIAVTDVASCIRESASVKDYLDAYKMEFSGFGSALRKELVDDPLSVDAFAEKEAIAQKLFGLFGDIELVDPYDAFQDLDDAWHIVEEDLEIMQTEGFDAINKVDPKTVLKKKGGKSFEVQEGWKGRIAPFPLVQTRFLHEELHAIEEKRARIEACESKIQEIFDSLDEEDKAALGDAVKESGDAFVASKLKGAVKSLEDDEEDDLLKKAKEAQSLFDEQKKLAKEAKKDAAELEKKTKKVIEGLDDEQAREVIYLKWVLPLEKALDSLPHSAIEGLVSKVEELEEKYDSTLGEIDEKIRDEEKELSGMLGKLTGSDTDMQAIEKMIELLGGDAR